MTKSKDQNPSVDEESQNTTFDEEDVKTVQCTEDVSPTSPQQQDYPAVLESAPFPALGSLEEITQTLSRVRSNQTQKNEKSILGELLVDQDEQLPFKQIPYHTDGIRNPGWLTVLSCFLVNFFVFGTTFAWGNYQKL